MSKSEMKRIATLNPIKAAEMLQALEDENKKLRAGLESFFRHEFFNVFDDCADNLDEAIEAYIKAKMEKLLKAD